ncbi:zinc finger protein 544-like [Bos javanicus]|uniref:zinc finger protein 544-like n=1 Tax=Bos javanicus TaxID=9906 RepID=UPI002AA6D97D|nr:zinc finger protein 544-like [Bos javanicus]
MEAYFQQIPSQTGRLHLKESVSEEDIAVEGPSYHMEKKHHVQEEGPRIFSAENSKDGQNYGNINHSLSLNEHKPTHLESQFNCDKCLVQTELSHPGEALLIYEEDCDASTWPHLLLTVTSFRLERRHECNQRARSFSCCSKLVHQRTLWRKAL